MGPYVQAGKPGWDIMATTVKISIASFVHGLLSGSPTNLTRNGGYIKAVSKIFLPETTRPKKYGQCVLYGLH